LTRKELESEWLKGMKDAEAGIASTAATPPCVLGREVALPALPPCSTRRYPAPLNAFPTCLPPRKGALVPVVDPKKKEGYAELIGLTYPEAAAATGI
jgi:hypothetical protein